MEVIETLTPAKAKEIEEATRADDLLDQVRNLQAHALDILERIDDALHIIVQGTERIKVLEWKLEDPLLRAVVEILPDPATVDAEEVEAMKRNVQGMIQQALALLPGIQFSPSNQMSKSRPTQSICVLEAQFAPVCSA